MRLVVIFLLIIALTWTLTWLPPANAQGNTFYVAPNGSDSNPGSLSQPWHTIQHAADVLSPGDTVFVRSGTYNEEVTLTRSGLPGRPITFATYASETAILDGGGTLNSAFATDFSNPDPRVSDITIDGFTIRNYRSFGIVAWSINDRLTLTNLTIRNNDGAGIRLSNSDGTRVQNVLLQNNEGGFDCTPILPGAETDPGCTNLRIADTQAIDNGTQGDTGTDAFAVERGDHIVIERSLAAGGPGDGFDIKGSRATLSRVMAYNTRNNIKLWGTDSTLVNALAYDARADANLVLVAGGSYTVTNVTVANMAGTAYLVVVGDESGSGSTPVRLYNTIFYNDNPAMDGTLLWFGPGVSLTANNNLYYNPYRTDAVICVEFAPYNGQCFSDADINNHLWQEAHSRYANPSFVNPAAKDFHLAPGSPAIDAGDPAGAPGNDLDDRPRDSRPDIGAYEYGPAVSPSATPTATPTGHHLTATPTHGHTTPTHSTPTPATATPLPTATSAPTTTVAIHVDGTVRYQTISGFGASLTPFETEDIYWRHNHTQPRRVTATQADREAIAQMLYTRLGLNRTRVGLSGFEPQNDNADPFTFNPAGFDWRPVDPHTDWIALARPYGLQTWWATFSVDGGEREAWLRQPGSNCALNRTKIDEEVEWLLAAALRFRQVGLDLPYMAVNNEPDLCPQHGMSEPGFKIEIEDMVTIVKRLGARLRAEGLSTQIVVSDGWLPQRALPYMQAVLADPDARQYVGALAYHAYDGYDDLAQLDAVAAGNSPHSSVEVREQIRDLAAQYRLPVWMTEVCYCTPRGRGDFDLVRARLNHIHDELTIANVSAFDAMNLFFIDRPGVRDELVHVYFRRDDPARPDDGVLDRYEISTYGYLLGHYSRFVVPGSVRLKANSSDPRVRVTAFERPDGMPVIVVINNNPFAVQADITLASLSQTPASFSVLTSREGAIWQNQLDIPVGDTGVLAVLPPLSVTTYHSAWHVFLPVILKP